MRYHLQLGLKRTFDIVVCAMALVLLSPIIALIALVIKIDDGGPIVFVQERAGKDGKPFRCLKFRTMVVGAAKLGRGLEVARDDERITRVGRFLRSLTLDEIPQMINILKGDMSIVGPRPTIQSQVDRYTAHQRRRLQFRPGMAGWAWIHGRNRLPWSERIELDIWYVDHWSFALDLKILFKAFLMLLRREGVYGDDGAVRDLD